MARRELAPASAVLWASAFVLGALILLQAGRTPSAVAETAVGPSGTYQILTLSNGLGPFERRYEAVYVLDQRAETLSIYYIQSNSDPQGLRLRSVTSLPSFFRTARGGS